MYTKGYMAFGTVDPPPATPAGVVAMTGVEVAVVPPSTKGVVLEVVSDPVAVPSIEPVQDALNGQQAMLPA